MLRQFKDAYETNDAEESQWRARPEVLGGAASSGRQHVEESRVERNESGHVDPGLEVTAQSNDRRAGDQSNDQFEREPSVTDGLNDEERTEPVGWLAVGLTVRPHEPR